MAVPQPSCLPILIDPKLGRALSLCPHDGAFTAAQDGWGIDWAGLGTWKEEDQPLGTEELGCWSGQAVALCSLRPRRQGLPLGQFLESLRRRQPCLAQPGGRQVRCYGDRGQSWSLEELQRLAPEGGSRPGGQPPSPFSALSNRVTHCRTEQASPAPPGLLSSRDHCGPHTRQGPGLTCYSLGA